MSRYTPLRAPRHAQLNLRGIQHRLTWWGAPTDNPIVLLHGFMDCGPTWQFLVDRLPAGWSFVAPDWRGFGGSGWASQGYWFPDYLADLEALLDAVAPGGRARLIGHSMGANVATLYAGIRPQRLEWLINLEGLGLPRTQPSLAPAHYAHWLDEIKEPLRARRYSSVEELAGVLRRRNPRLSADRADFVARAWSRGVTSAGSEGPAGGRAVGLDDEAVELAFDPRHRMANPVLYRLEEAEACWSQIVAPMLLLVGGASDHLERRERLGGEAQLHTLFRALRLVTLPGLGHMMHHEDPQAVADQILEFERSQA